jgi:hypothetical protein
MRIGLAHRMSGGLRRPAAGDENLPLWPLALGRPHEKGQRPPTVRIAVKLPMLIEALERRRIGMALVETAHLIDRVFEDAHRFRKLGMGVRRAAAALQRRRTSR